MIKTIFALFIAAGSVLGQVQVVQTVGAYENAPSVAQWFFPSTGVSIKPGHLLLVEGSVAAGTMVKPTAAGWQLATCDQPGSSVNSNGTAAGSEEIQIWYKVATTDVLPLAFTFSAAQAYTNAVYREISGADPNIPIDYCWLAAHPETANAFATPAQPAPSVGDLAIGVLGAYRDAGQHPTVGPPAPATSATTAVSTVIAPVASVFSTLGADEQASGWSIHDSVAGPLSSDTVTPVSAGFNFTAPVAGNVVTGLIWIKAAGTQGFGEQPGIALMTSSGTRAVAEGQSITINFNRAVSLSTAGVGTWSSCTPNCTSVTYTAPAQVTGAVIANGVVLAPPDSIYSVPISNFPVSQYSAQWLANMHTMEPAANGFIWNGGAWGMQLIDSTTPLVPHTSWPYGCPECSIQTPFPAPPITTRQHEQGAFDDGAWSYDTHESFLNYQTGQVWSLYGVNASAANSGNQGATYNSNSMLPWDKPGSGSAGGLAYEPLLLTPDDVYFGVSHPLDVAFPEFSPGVCGYGTYPWGDYGYQWPAAYTNSLCSKADATGTVGSVNGIATTPATAGLPGLGAWYRLSNAWCNANLGTYSGFVQTILAGFCNRGLILTDWSGGGNFAGHADTALQQDPAVMAAIATANTLLSGLWNNPATQSSAFEFVDVSSASTCATWSNCGYNTRVSPASQYLASNPPAYVQAVASDGGTDAPITFNLAVLPLGVGTLHKYITVPAGTQGLVLSAFVTNAVNQGIAWSKNAVLSNGTATVNSSSGAVTLAASVNTVTFDYFVAASVQDPNAKTMVVVKTIPANADGSIRIDNGSSVPVYTDAKGLNWVGDRALGLRAQTLMTNNATNWPAGAPDQHIWQTSTETVYYGAGDIDMGDFFVGPNAKFRVTTMLNPDRPTGSGAPGTPLWGVTDSQFYSGTGYNFAGPTPVSANGSFGGWANWGLLADVNHRYTAATDYRYSFPALATNDGFIDVRVFTSIPNGIRHSASVAGLYLTPDAAAPYWDIQSFSGSLITNAGTPLNLYLRDWYTGAGSYVSYSNNRYAPLVSSDLAHDATWSIVQQGCIGSAIDPVKGVYTPPATVPATCMDVVEISNSAYAATANVTVRPTVTIPAVPAAPVTTGP